jgi:hypothetical protein
LLLAGTDSTLLEEAHHVVNLREIAEEFKFKRISKITASGFSTVLAFLLCLDIDKDEIFREVIGLEALVQTN